MSYFNGSEMDAIINQIGTNKVIGTIQEKGDIVQQEKITIGTEHMEIPREHYPCPYEMFKKYRAHPKEKEKENKNTLFALFLSHIDPMVTLSEHALEKELDNFKLTLSVNLDNDRNYYRKLGFSRKKNALPLSDMKKELENKDTDGKLSHDTLFYMCKIANINLYVIDPCKLVKEELFGHDANTAKSIVVVHHEVWEVDPSEKVESVILRCYMSFKKMDHVTFLKQVEQESFAQLRSMLKFFIPEKDQKHMSLRKKDDIMKCLHGIKN